MEDVRYSAEIPNETILSGETNKGNIVFVLRKKIVFDGDKGLVWIEWSFLLSCLVSYDTLTE